MTTKGMYHNPRYITLFRQMSEIAGLVVFAIGGIALIGWILRLPDSNHGFAWAFSMKANVALSFLLAGISMWLLQDKLSSPLSMRISQACALAVVLIGVLTLGEYLFGLDLKIDEALFKDSPATVRTAFPGRMSPITALDLTILGIAMLIMTSETGGCLSVSHTIVFCASIFPVTGLLGHLHDLTSLYYGAYNLTAMALPVIIGLLLLCLGILLARPGRGLVKILVSEGPGGAMARRLLLAALFLPIAIDILSYLGETLGMYGHEAQTALHVVTVTVVMAFIVLLVSFRLERADLRRREYEYIVSASNEHMSLIGRDYIYRSVNDAYLKAHMKKREEILGHSIAELLTKETFEGMVRENFDRCLNGESINYRAWFDFPGLGRRCMEVFYYPFYGYASTPGGPVSGVVVISRDITERALAEEALKAKDELMERYNERLEEMVLKRTRELEDTNSELKKIFSAVEQAAEGIVITDPDGAIQYVNPAFSLMTGYQAEEVSGVNPKILNSGKNPPALFEGLWKTVLSGRKWSGIIINKKKTGELYPEEMAVSPVTDEEGKITNFIAIKNDITERIEAEENLRKNNIELENARLAAEAANRAKSVFIANMSHELRTPLNHIIGFSEMMREGMAGPMTERQKEYSGDIAESGNRLLSVLNEILDLSRLDAGETGLELSEFDLRNMLDSSLAFFKEKALKHDIKTSSEIEDGLSLITADQKKIKQVVVSLLGNALKFSPDGGAVSVRARKIEAEKMGGYEVAEKNISSQPLNFSTSNRNFIEISVADTGPGISVEDRKRLFQSFEQLESPYTKTHGGIGLGLFLSKKLVEMHGGRIWEGGEEGKGSKFIFTLPGAY